MAKSEDEKKEEKEEKKESTGGVIFHGQANIEKSMIAGGNISGTLSIEEISQKLNIEFEPLFEAAKQAPSDKRDEAVEKVQKIQEEVAKQDKADDGLIAGLLEDLVELVPSAVAAIATTFGQPLLAGLAGPATKYVLKKITGKSETKGKKR